MATLLAIGDQFKLSFPYENDGPNKAFNTRAKVELDPSLMLLGIEVKDTSNLDVGAINPLDPEEYIIGDNEVDFTATIFVSVEIVAVSQSLITGVRISRDGTEADTTNNYAEKNIITVFDGVFDPGAATADNLGNHTAIQSLNMSGFQIENELIPIKDSYAQALSDLGSGRKFRWKQNNLDGVPSPNNSTMGFTT